MEQASERGWLGSQRQGALGARGKAGGQRQQQRTGRRRLSLAASERCRQREKGTTTAPARSIDCALHCTLSLRLFRRSPRCAASPLSPTVASAEIASPLRWMQSLQRSRPLDQHSTSNH